MAVIYVKLVSHKLCLLLVDTTVAHSLSKMHTVTVMERQQLVDTRGGGGRQDFFLRNNFEEKK